MNDVPRVRLFGCLLRESVSMSKGLRTDSQHFSCRLSPSKSVLLHGVGLIPDANIQAEVMVLIRSATETLGAIYSILPAEDKEGVVSIQPVIFPRPVQLRAKTDYDLSVSYLKVSSQAVTAYLASSRQFSLCVVFRTKPIFKQGSEISTPTRSSCNIISMHYALRKKWLQTRFEQVSTTRPIFSVFRPPHVSESRCGKVFSPAVRVNYSSSQLPTGQRHIYYCTGISPPFGSDCFDLIAFTVNSMYSVPRT